MIKVIEANLAHRKCHLFVIHAGKFVKNKIKKKSHSLRH